MSKYILGGGISGLILLECLKDHILISDNIGGQNKELFTLGPRILHYSKKIEKFLRSIGITDNTIPFYVGYKDGNTVRNVINPEQRLKYFNKTRPGMKFTESCLSGNQNKIIGWDINDINLINILYERNKDRIVSGRAELIDTSDNMLFVRTKDDLILAKYSEIISTIDLEILRKLFVDNKSCELKKGEVHFSLIYNPKESNSPLEMFAYIYDVSDSIINRITYIDKDHYVIESNQELVLPYKDYSGIKINSIKLKTQILREIKIKEYRGIKLVGRYAQYDHSVKASNIIEKYYEE